MSGVLTVAKKELRTWFQSPVAILFVGVFLVVTLFTFFTSSAFFARNIADVRPLFEWLPLLEIFLVSAIAMRAWAEEQKMGTLEVLLTLPVRTADLVLGKFLAGMALVVLALALTAPIPLMVGHLGDLDWGPVIGGYVGAVCLAAAYLAIGSCVSARTDNQVVALMVTLVLGGALYLVGTDAVTGLFGNQGAEILRELGTGSRFHSIERGVLDLRDLAYYVSIAAFFLVLNIYFLEARRFDTGSARGRSQQGSWILLLLLSGANAVALPVWLAPITQLRLDLTENRDYSVSDTTARALASLDEPLVIQGVFSAKTHPKLAPLIPQIEDMLQEYAVHGNGRVKVEIVDPTTDADVEQAMNEEYGIHSVPFKVTDSHQQSVVNSYFAILVKYGDKYQTLSFQDLIEVQPEGADVTVRLRNLEYDLTRVIRKVSGEFSTLPALLQKLPEGSQLVLYTTPSTLPDDEKAVADLVRNTGHELEAKSGGKLKLVEVDPSTDPALQQQLAKDYGIQPFAADLFATTRFYLNVLLKSGDKAELVPLRGEMGQADFEKAVESSVKRVSPGQLQGLALLTETPQAPPQRDPRQPPQEAPPPDYQAVEQVLGDNYTVQRVDLADGHVPDDAQTLLVAKPGKLTEQQRFAIDQFLMRGGALVVLAGSYQMEVDQSGLHAVKSDSGLADLLATYGVRVSDKLVMDKQNVNFPFPVTERRGPYMVRRIQMMPYPFLVDIRPDGFDRSSPIVSGVQNVTAPWASTLEVTADPAAATSDVVLQTSADSWLSTDGNVNPDFEKFPDTGFAVGTDLARRPVGVVLTGKFKSAFADKDAPHEDGKPAPHKLTESPANTRLAVIGSSEIASDILMSIAQQSGGEVHRGDLQMLQNLVDWSVEDTELLQIRSAGAFARTLRPMTDAERTAWMAGLYALTLVGLLLVSLVPRQLRSLTKPVVVPRLEVA
jgi:ABC-2 type transport system permease protein